MNNKKAEEDAWYFMKSIIVGLILVGILAVIVFRSISTSTTSIFESLKKMLGFGTKAEASTTNTDDCTIKRYYWSKNSVRTGENAEIIIEGKGKCNGKNVNINIFKDISFWPDSQLRSTDAPFKETIINVNWPTNEKGKYYFKLKFGDYTSPESERLEIV